MLKHDDPQRCNRETLKSPTQKSYSVSMKQLLDFVTDPVCSDGGNMVLLIEFSPCLGTLMPFEISQGRNLLERFVTLCHKDFKSHVAVIFLISSASLTYFRKTM